ncbi:CYTH and CHAD domain-containing protein [Acinetobacter sp.]|uniref:CYTH and CHAD domain-containing protein n=1 Tax=Acinetobacter sp. TaxID=472 RepID=UPI002649107E|nr:CYTH and CHAD domain-containing protein [Acinetobacter sp.]MDN5512858.1 CYTH and CHAD domain-containing protein [Acinetobacter sp.]MDN5525881.1 CYTH and CHAD domain-containing protein [Acinetobacter sp.]
MLEVELKFQIPASHQEKLYQLFLNKNARLISLYAKYYDTPERHLAQQKISLRQRLEDDHWIQTLKAPSDHSLQRFELETYLGKLENPSLDLEIYQSHAKAKQLLQKALGKQAKNLTVQYETVVQRLVHVIHFNRSKIEVSLDRGEIRHNDQSVSIYEIEFELKQGSIQDLIKFIHPWVQRYHLWLDVRSKAQRGDLLAQDLTIPPAQFATPLHLNSQDSTDSALKQMINNALQHLLPNASTIAAEQYDSEHVHQARVAMRRLRSALCVFDDWSDEVNPQWQEQLTSLFRQLGATRDHDALNEGLLPQLQQAGGPSIELPNIAEENQIAVDESLRCSDFVELILDLLQFVHQPSKKQKKSGLKKDIAKKLQKLHHQICKDAEQFLDLDISSRHRTRKRVKRLRYCVEFVASLYPKKDVKRYLKDLKPAQESLGQYNDLMVAEVMFQNIVKRKQKAWFAVGWIANEKKYILQQAKQHLDDYSKTDTFW